MGRDVIADSGMVGFAEVGLIIFISVFILIIIRAVFMNKDHAEHMEKLPLDDGQQSESTHTEREANA